jgi:hypothetical protein
MNEGALLKRLFERVVAEYAEFVFHAWDDEREEVIGVGHAIPAAWDGDRASLPDGDRQAAPERPLAPSIPSPPLCLAFAWASVRECHPSRAGYGGASLSAE